MNLGIERRFGIVVVNLPGMNGAVSNLEVKYFRRRIVRSSVRRHWQIAIAARVDADVQHRPVQDQLTELKLPAKQWKEPHGYFQFSRSEQWLLFGCVGRLAADNDVSKRKGQMGPVDLKGPDFDASSRTREGLLLNFRSREIAEGRCVNERDKGHNYEGKDRQNCDGDSTHGA